MDNRDSRWSASRVHGELVRIAEDREDHVKGTTWTDEYKRI